MGNWKYYPVSTLPAPFDIVWCRFPDHLDLGNPGPKQRPALVLTTAIQESGMRPIVQVIYGTSKTKMQQRPHDFFVMNYQEMYEAGLHEATRFDLDRILSLPWSSDFFVPISAQYSSPVVGHLSERMVRLLGHVLSEHQIRKKPQNDNE